MTTASYQSYGTASNFLTTNLISVGSLPPHLVSRDNSLEFVGVSSTELGCAASTVLKKIDSCPRESFIDEYEVRDEASEASEIEKYELRAEFGVESDTNANESRTEGEAALVVVSNSGRESISLPRLSAF